ncbi:MAG: hypothetical protein DMG48_02865 [Acidobacteria bacterium]|nr:MAG: hypothetical protein DMG48_02865 [Acidobacteriota bacterium]
MIFDHLLTLLKLIVPAFMRKEKAPVVASPSSSTLVFDSRDAAIYSLCIALVFTTLAVFFLAAFAARR